MNGSAMPGRDAFSRFVAAACGGPRGWRQRSNTSMTIMRPPQQGHGKVDENLNKALGAQ